jgi:hypothetical protein
MRETRLRIRKDHARMAAFVDDCIDHHIAGHADKALSALRRALEYLGEGFDLPEKQEASYGSQQAIAELFAKLNFISSDW